LPLRFAVTFATLRFGLPYIYGYTFARIRVGVYIRGFAFSPRSPLCLHTLTVGCRVRFVLIYVHSPHVPVFDSRTTLVYHVCWLLRSVTGWLRLRSRSRALRFRLVSFTALHVVLVCVFVSVPVLRHVCVPYAYVAVVVVCVCPAPFLTFTLVFVWLGSVVATTFTFLRSGTFHIAALVWTFTWTSLLSVRFADFTVTVTLVGCLRLLHTFGCTVRAFAQRISVITFGCRLVMFTVAVLGLLRYSHCVCSTFVWRCYVAFRLVYFTRALLRFRCWLRFDVYSCYVAIPHYPHALPALPSRLLRGLRVARSAFTFGLVPHALVTLVVALTASLVCVRCAVTFTFCHWFDSTLHYVPVLFPQLPGSFVWFLILLTV